MRSWPRRQGSANGAHGAIALTNGEACATNVTLTGPVSNAGTIASEPAIGGTRTVQGNLTNTGTLAIDANTAYNGASALLTNEGALNVAEAIQLTVSDKGSVTNGAGGTISATGSGEVFLGSGTSFSEGAGTTVGAKPVIVDDGTLGYTGSGKSLIGLRGSDTLSGSLGGAQSLLLESTCGENATATAGASFTNAGTITLTNGEECATNATLAISAGTLTNSGTIATEPATGGTRTVQGNVTNKGTLAIDTNSAYNGASALLTNEGALERRRSHSADCLQQRLGDQWRRWHDLRDGQRRGLLGLGHVVQRGRRHDSGHQAGDRRRWRAQLYRLG